MIGQTTLSMLQRVNATRNLGFMALGMLTSSLVPTKCDSSKDGIWESLFPKDNKGNVSWDTAGRQVTDSIFWDKLARATGQKLQGALDSGIPTHLTYGFFSGFCSGMALKKVGKAVSVVLGLGFMTLQTLSFYGYVKVDHGQLQRDFNDFLDLNKDGTIDTHDGKAAYGNVLKVLQFNLPAGGGFAAGFLGGLRNG